MKKNTLHFKAPIALLTILFFSSPGYSQNFWQQTNGPPGGFVVTLAINSSSDIFAGALDPGVFRSSDNGDTWTQINTGLTDTTVRALVINSSGDIFAGADDVFRSTDNGDTWSKINVGLTNTFAIDALAINNSNGHIFAGTNGDGVFRSSDNGETWSQINSGLTNTDVQAFAFSVSGYTFVGTNDPGGVFRSNDNGDNWSQINTGLTNTDVRVFAINSSGDIFAGTDNPGGVFRSSDNGNTWSQISTGLTDTDVQALAINSSGDIFAGTIKDGVFRSVESTTAVEEISTPIPSTFALKQNYPNPFNPSTSIRYELTKTSSVVLQIFDVLGREVRELVNGVKPAGLHEVKWDGLNDAGLPVSSGLYLYRIENQNQVVMKKMVLMR